MLVESPLLEIVLFWVVILAAIGVAIFLTSVFSSSK
jgi:hypothetical protein